MFSSSPKATDNVAEQGCSALDPQVNVAALSPRKRTLYDKAV